MIGPQLHGQYTGGDGDGFVSLGITIVDVNYLKGGDADGFALLSILDSDDYVFEGGDADGFAGLSVLNTDDYVFEGGDADGFAGLSVLDPNDNVYDGGESDGFALLNAYTEYVWTGNVGTGWNVTGNWSTNQVPSLRHRVIIPASAASWPFVNAGILAIGRDPMESGAYFADEIIIEANAQMTTRINCFVRNYGKFEIVGSLFVKNNQNDAFVNKVGGEFRILNNGIAIMGDN